LCLNLSEMDFWKSKKLEAILFRTYGCDWFIVLQNIQANIDLPLNKDTRNEGKVNELINPEPA